MTNFIRTKNTTLVIALFLSITININADIAPAFRQPNTTNYTSLIAAINDLAKSLSCLAVAPIISTAELNEAVFDANENATTLQAIVDLLTNSSDRSAAALAAKTIAQALHTIANSNLAITTTINATVASGQILQSTLNTLVLNGVGAGSFNNATATTAYNTFQSSQTQENALAYLACLRPQWS